MFARLFTRITKFLALSVLLMMVNASVSIASDTTTTIDSTLTIQRFLEGSESIHPSTLDIKTPFIGYVYDSGCNEDDVLGKICSTCAQCVPALISALKIAFQSNSTFYSFKLNPRIETTQLPAVDPPRSLPPIS